MAMGVADRELGPQREGLGRGMEDGLKPIPVPLQPHSLEFLLRCTNSCTGHLVIQKNKTKDQE